MSSKSAHEIWLNFKDTSSFVAGIKEKAIDLNMVKGDCQIVETTWADSPVEVEIDYVDEDDNILQVRPVFMGEVLHDFECLIIKM